MALPRQSAEGANSWTDAPGTFPLVAVAGAIGTAGGLAYHCASLIALLGYGRSRPGRVEAARRRTSSDGWSASNIIHPIMAFIA